jgi:hypothetical protein
LSWLNLFLSRFSCDCARDSRSARLQLAARALFTLVSTDRFLSRFSCDCARDSRSARLQLAARTPFRIGSDLPGSLVRCSLLARFSTSVLQQAYVRFVSSAEGVKSMICAWLFCVNYCRISSRSFS